MNSTAGQFRDFIEGVVWTDIQGELDSWISDLRGVLEDPDGNIDPKFIGSIRGSIQACKNFKEMPDVILEALEDDTERDAKKRKKNLKKWREK